MACKFDISLPKTTLRQVWLNLFDDSEEEVVNVCSQPEMHNAYLISINPKMLCANFGKIGLVVQEKSCQWIFSMFLSSFTQRHRPSFELIEMDFRNEKILVRSFLRS